MAITVRCMIVLKCICASFCHKLSLLSLLFITVVSIYLSIIVLSLAFTFNAKVDALLRETNMTSFSTSFACLQHHKDSLRGKVKDYVISFNEPQQDIEAMTEATFEVVQQLFLTFNDRRVYGRLVAKVDYIQMNYEQGIMNERSYHFPSYSREEIEDVHDFFVKHMMKIASRMESFNANGSNLLIKKIEHIHIQLTFLES